MKNLKHFQSMYQRTVHAFLFGLKKRKYKTLKFHVAQEYDNCFCSTFDIAGTLKGSPVYPYEWLDYRDPSAAIWALFFKQVMPISLSSEPVIGYLTWPKRFKVELKKNWSDLLPSNGSLRTIYYTVVISTFRSSKLLDITVFAVMLLTFLVAKYYGLSGNYYRYTVQYNICSRPVIFTGSYTTLLQNSHCSSTALVAMFYRGHV